MVTLLNKERNALAYLQDASLQTAYKVWRDYVDCLSASYDDLGEVRKRYLLRPGDASAGVLPLNALVPLLLSEPFGIQHTETRERVARANLYLDHFTQVLDDTTDVMGEASPFALHLSHHLLAKGMCLYLGLTTDAHSFSHILEGYFEEAMGAERYLWRHHGKIASYDDTDFAMIGRRCALMKASGAIYADLSGNCGPLDAIERGLDAAATGVQLVDDLIDWYDDFSEGIYTHPYVLAFESCGCSSLSDVEPKKIEKVLFCDGPADEVLGLAKHFFDEGVKHFDSAGASGMVFLIQDLMSSLLNVQQAVSELKQLGSSGVVSEGGLTVHLRGSLDVRLMH